MNSPQQVFSPQFAALQNQYNQLQEIYSQINAGKAPSVQSKQSSLKYVDGPDGAREYQKGMAPNSSDTVFDKNESVFYALSVDANGVPAPIKRCPFTMEDLPEPVNTILTKQDLDDFKAEIRAMFANGAAKKNKPSASAETEVSA